MSLRIMVWSVAVLLLAACGASGNGAVPTPATFTLTGSLKLTDVSNSYRWDVDEPCSGSGGYSDMTAGRDVVVRDREGTVIAKGSLQAGIGMADKIDCGPPGEHPLCDPMGGRACRFEFTVGQIPKSDFYALDLGRRGSFTYSFEELEGLGWRVEYAIGD